MKKGLLVSRSFLVAIFIALGVLLVLLYLKKNTGINQGVSISDIKSTDSCEAATDIISNGSFENEKTNWSFFTDTYGSFSIGTSGIADTRSADIQIKSRGSNVQLYQNGFQLQPNTTYTLKFSAYSNTGHDIDVKIHRHSSPYTNWGLEAKADVTTNWKEFTYTFKTTGFSTATTDTRLRFWMAPYATSGDMYYFDNVSLVAAIPNVTPAVTAKPVTPAPTVVVTQSPATTKPVATAVSTTTPSQQTNNGKSRGYWTTPEELKQIKAKADLGKEPYKSNVANIIKEAAVSWPGRSSISGTFDVGQYESGTGEGTYNSHFYRGGKNLYAKAMVYTITGNTSYAAFVREKLLDVTDVKFTGPDAPIMVGWQLPAWIQAADLLEGWSGWTAGDKKQFQNWLATAPYQNCQRVGQVSDNNWGPACSNLNAMIGDYLSNSGIVLQDIDWIQTQQLANASKIEEADAAYANLPKCKVTRTPGEAYKFYTERQLARMRYRSYPWTYKSNACKVNGIMWHGGIPAELRRGDENRGIRGDIEGQSGSWCQYTFVPDDFGSNGAPYAAFTYQQVHIAGGLIGHAEMALRRGDKRIFDQIENRGGTEGKSGSLLAAIRFIIANPTDASKSYDWDPDRKAGLEIAYRYYRDSEIKARLQGGSKNKRGEQFDGTYTPYAMLTHGFASDENPGLPPVTPVSR